MQREFKGTCVQQYISEYTVIDLETTGVNISFDEIIEISALKVRNNEVVDEFSTLINPGMHIPEEATEVNHITDQMVKDAPRIEEVIDSFFDFVGDDVILGFNNAAFDLNILYDLRMNLKGIPLENDYIDILHSVRKCLCDLENSKLATACEYYGLDTEGEHRALKDCYLTKECYDHLNKDFGDKAFYRSSKNRTGNTMNYTEETLLLRELNALLDVVLEDGKVSTEEFEKIKDWMDEHVDLYSEYPFNTIFDAFDKVLEDGVVTQEELEELRCVFGEFVDPVSQAACHDDVDDITDKHVCLTGEFECGSRVMVSKMIESAGGIVDKGIKMKTDYLVVGANGSENWKAGKYGNKILKALEYNEKGSDIKIMDEGDFMGIVDK